MRMQSSFPAFVALLLAANLAMAKSPVEPGPAARPMGPVGPVRHAGPPPIYQEQYSEPDYGPGPDIGLSGNSCAEGCGDCCQQDCCDNHRFCLAAGFAFVFVKPHFESDIAFTTTTNDTQSRTNTVRETSFDYDLELTPRVWLEICKPTQLGFRVTYWQFDHLAPPEEGVRSAAASTVQQTIAVPVDFAGIDIAVDQPGDILRATADLDMDVLDFEGTKWTDFCSWQFGTTAGLRYASVKQSYRAAAFTSAEVVLDTIDASHRFDGIGPTFSVEARRGMGCLTWFSMARGSLLYGNGKSGVTALEDITPSAIGTTTITSLERNDVLTVGELQLGLEWCRTYCNGKRVFCRTALEGQVWQGAGGPLSEDGDLGLFGFHAALGMTL